MKTLVLYATKHGAAREIAEKIVEAMDGATLGNLKGEGAPSLDEYDRVVIGGSLYAGMLRKEAKAFVKAHEAALLKMPVGLFLSGLREEGVEEYFQVNVPQAVLEHAKVRRFLGGIYDPQKCGFLERMLLKLLGKTEYEDTISQEAIQAFVEEMDT